VGGWLYGRDCPGIELFWKFKKDADSPTAFFRMKDGKIIILDTGMAMFTPDCNYFWLTGYHGDVITVFDTASGKWISSFSGYYPVWSSDSKKIYVSMIGKKYQLWVWSLPERTKTLIVEVTDYCRCYPPGESVDWHPVQFDAKGNIKWSYSTCETQEGDVLWKVLTIDPSSEKIQKVQIMKGYCER
jgi:hypothetical protein